jgi:3-isopropylmalate/(R)-2-methylmalate dehydratase large subunit
MTRITLPGCILFLSADPAKIDTQLARADLSLEQAGPLRDDVSTDEITPLPSLVYFDERLASHPYTGYKAGERLPIGLDAVRQGGFGVTVVGKRYGKGSSRKHSPVAEKAAGIRLVIAESFERIYRQNTDNVGLFTSTDFGLIERIRSGEEIDIDELVGNRDRIAAAVLRSGGLLRYGREHLHSVSAIESVSDGQGPQTLFEKILDRHVLKTADLLGDLTPGTGGFIRADIRFIHDIYTGMCSYMLHETFGRPVQLYESESIIVFEDHYSYAHRSRVHVERGLLPQVHELSRVHREFAADYGLRSHGYLPGGEGSEGISHALMAEQYALPGQLIVGTDSRTPHSGALGCLAFGVRTTDIANSMVTGAVRVAVPEVLRIELSGTLPRGVTAKDIVLHLLALPGLKAGTGVGKVFEFGGPGIAQLNTDERATLTNMTAELGGFTGIVEPDAETVRFLKERRGIDVTIEPWMCSDEGAAYAEVIRIDLSALSPMVAAPGTLAMALIFPSYRSVLPSTSPMAGPAPPVSGRILTATTRSSRGRQRGGSRFLLISSSSFSSAPPRFGTTASRRVILTPSHGSGPRFSSRRVAPVQTADPGHRPAPIR